MVTLQPGIQCFVWVGHALDAIARRASDIPGIFSAWLFAREPRTKGFQSYRSMTDDSADLEIGESGGFSRSKRGARMFLGALGTLNSRLSTSTSRGGCVVRNRIYELRA